MSAIALVTGNAKATEADASANSLAQALTTFTSNITAGNLLIAGTSWNSDGTTDDAVITDGAGNSWTRVGAGPTYDVADGGAITIYYAPVTAGAGTKPTVTAAYYTNTGHGTPKSVQYRAIHVSEWSIGSSATWTLDKSGSNYQTSVGNGANLLFAPNATVTPTTDGQLVYGYICQFGGGTGNSAFLTAGTNFTELTKVATASPAGYFYETEYYVQPTAGALQATWTQTGVSSSSWCQSLMATFKAVASGGFTAVQRRTSSSRVGSRSQ